MPSGFYDGFAFADYTVRLDQQGRFEQFAAAVTLVTPRSFATTVGAFTLNEAVREETLVMLAEEHLPCL